GDAAARACARPGARDVRSAGAPGPGAPRSGRASRLRSARAAGRGAGRRRGAGGAAVSRFPLRYVHQNILVGHGDARAALFRVQTVSYPFLAAAEKRAWLRRLARFAFAVEADFSLWR